MEDLREIVEKAVGGDRAALSDLIEKIRDRIYRLSLKMLWHPEDAQDAAQEILIRLITNLGKFRGESSFETWMYRVAANHLLNFRKSRGEKRAVDFEDFEGAIDRGLAFSNKSTVTDVEEAFLLQEVKVGCMQGLLLCLDRDHRLAYILSEIFELKGPDGATALEITPEAFRKRLSRAREKVRNFMKKKCGVYSEANPCSCKAQLPAAMDATKVQPDNLLFGEFLGGDKPDTKKAVEDLVTEMDELEYIAGLYKSHPDFNLPASVTGHLQELLQAGKFRILT